MNTRSNSKAVRNPIAACPMVEAVISEMSPEAREGLRKMLTALAATWRIKAEHSWRKHKPPMAAYWKQNAVNARHLALALRQVQS